MHDTLPQAGEGVHPSAFGSVPFVQIMMPVHRLSRRWTPAQKDVYHELVAQCANRPDYRVKAAEVAALYDYSPDTVRRVLRELVRLGVVRSPDPEHDADGRRWRFAWMEGPSGYPYEPREAEPDEGRPVTRRKGRGNPRPRLPRGGTHDPTIVGGHTPRSRSYDRDPHDRTIVTLHYPDLPDQDLKKQPPSKALLAKAQSTDGRRGSVDQRLGELARAAGFGTYQRRYVTERLQRARRMVEYALGVCPLPTEWVAFGEDTFRDPTIHHGSDCRLSVALCSTRVLSWFEARYREPSGGGDRKRLTDPTTAEQTRMAKTVQR